MAGAGGARSAASEVNKSIGLTRLLCGMGGNLDVGEVRDGLKHRVEHVIQALAVVKTPRARLGVGRKDG